MCIYIHAATVEAGARPPRRVYEPPSTDMQSDGKRNYPIRVHDVIYITPTHTYISICPYISDTSVHIYVRMYVELYLQLHTHTCHVHVCVCNLCVRPEPHTDIYVYAHTHTLNSEP